jgi:hypothetical protein
MNGCCYWRSVDVVLQLFSVINAPFTAATGDMLYSLVLLCDCVLPYCAAGRHCRYAAHRALRAF